MPAAEQPYKDFSLSIHDKAAQDKRFVKVQFELTYACNLHCVHCYTDPLNRPDLLRKEMSFEQVLAALDKLADEGFLWICFTGGEIFMRKDFLDIYDYAYQKGFIITLFTNGTMITKSIADHLAKFPPFEIEISFHGATAETFDEIAKVPGSFDRCVSGIKMLLDRKLPVDLKTKAMTLNHHELGKIQTFVESLGLKFHLNCAIYPRLDGDTSSVNFRLSAEEVLQIEAAQPLALEGGCESASQEGYISSPAPEKLYRCGCGSIQAHIDPYGSMGTCVWARQFRFQIDETLLQQGMRTISEKIFSQKYTTSSQCRTCIAHEFCDKKPEMAVYEAASIQNPVSHYCDVAFGRLNQVKQAEEFYGSKRE